MKKGNRIKEKSTHIRVGRIAHYTLYKNVRKPIIYSTFEPSKNLI